MNFVVLKTSPVVDKGCREAEVCPPSGVIENNLIAYTLRKEHAYAYGNHHLVPSSPVSVTRNYFRTRNLLV